MDDVQERLLASRQRALATVRRTIETVTRVIEQNEVLRDEPGHRADAEQRIAEGHVELERLRKEEAVLAREVGDSTAG